MGLFGLGFGLGFVQGFRTFQGFRDLGLGFRRRGVSGSWGFELCGEGSFFSDYHLEKQGRAVVFGVYGLRFRACSLEGRAFRLFNPEKSMCTCLTLNQKHGNNTPQ